ncbi:MAG: M28 family peptidase [candidate division WOR-3 bacterium]|nr:M28 family peptidase [candidate division WOR-3 bacterium]MCR4424104.1 M28 family peptidase [candidate division WOR-3 bacterium]MDH7519477.1 M28 family peptidase [bacterium]
MKRTVLILGVALCALFAEEYLAIVPGVAPEQLAEKFRVVGQTDNGVLIVGKKEQITAYGGRVLDFDPFDKLYYRVRLVNWTAREELGKWARILDFDGAEFLVAVEPDRVEQLMKLPAMLGRVDLQGWVFNKSEWKAPPVFSNPLVEQIISQVSADSVLSYVRRLQRYRTRYSTSDSCRAAAEWIRQKFIAYGCDTVLMQYHTSGHAPNVIGIKYGVRGQRNPYAVVCGHFDSYAPSNAPGADDNASGTAAVIEAARVTQGFSFQNDLRFIAFSGEEFGLYGSTYYANQARAQGDSILGVLNFDMIGYVDAAPENLDVLGKIANPACEPFVDWFTAVADTYTGLPIYKQMVNDNQNSDHGPFWTKGYVAFCGIEDFWPANPYYHSAGDSIGAGYNNNEFCTQVTKTGVAGLALLGEPVPSNKPLLDLLRYWVDDGAGNNNGFWDPGESVGVYVTLKNFGVVDAHAVSARLSTADSFVTLFVDSLFLGDIPASESVIGSEPYTMVATVNTPREHPVQFELVITAQETSYQRRFVIPVGRYLITDPIPDNSQPPIYWAYDDIDTAWIQHPVYQWVEVNTIGTRLTFPHNDSVKVIKIPEGFGAFRFYGRVYDSLSISADGWLCPGFYRQPHYTNQPLPGSGTPPGVICVNWDDLYPGYNNAGFVYYHYDSLNHRLVIEYDSVFYYEPRTVRDKFQVLIYDSTVRTPTGDNVIVFQYKTANYTTSSTIGIQDPTRTIAIQVLYNGNYHHGAAPIVPGRAIKFTTVEATGLEESRLPMPVNGLFGPQVVMPNPARGVVQIRLTPAGSQDAEILIYDRSGRAVSRLKTSQGCGVWDTRSIPNGIYFLKVKGAKEVKKAVLIN